MRHSEQFFRLFRLLGALHVATASAILTWSAASFADPMAISDEDYGGKEQVDIDLRDAWIPEQTDPWSCGSIAAGRVLAHAESEDMQNENDYEKFKLTCPKELDWTKSWSSIFVRINANLPPNVAPFPLQVRAAAAVIPTMIHAINVFADIAMVIPGCRSLYRHRTGRNYTRLFEEPETGAGPYAMAAYMNEHRSQAQKLRRRHYVVKENATLGFIIRNVSNGLPVIMLVAGRQQIRPRFDHYVAKVSKYCWQQMNNACPREAPAAHYVVAKGFDKPTGRLHIKNSYENREEWWRLETVNRLWYWKLTETDANNPYLQSILTTFQVRPGMVIVEDDEPVAPDAPAPPTDAHFLSRPALTTPLLDTVNLHD